MGNELRQLAPPNRTRCDTHSRVAPALGRRCHRAQIRQAICQRWRKHGRGFQQRIGQGCTEHKRGPLLNVARGRFC
jgi:hypothetical protein